MTYFLEVLDPCYSGAITIFQNKKLTHEWHSAAKTNNVFIVGMEIHCVRTWPILKEDVDTFKTDNMG